jgi:hypothetical protein
METVFTAMLVLHIASGLTGLASGTFALFFSIKGSLHKKLGNIFFYAMAGVFVSSLYMSLTKGHWFLLCVGIFSFYLAASGKRMLAYKSLRSFENGPAITDHLLGVGGIVSGLGLWVLSILLLTQGNSFGIVPLVFGTLSVFLATRGYRMFWNPPTQKSHWAIAHGTRMGGAYAAMVTAFIVVNIQIEQQWILWLIPTLIIPPVIYYQVRRFLSAGKKPVVVAAFSGLLFFCQNSFAQSNHAAISLRGYGENIIAKVTTDFPEGSFVLTTRTLPGMNKPLLYADSSTRQGQQVKGKIYLLGGMPYRFEGFATPDSLMLALYAENEKAPVGKIVAGKAPRRITNISLACKQIKDTLKTYIFNKKEMEKPSSLEFLSKLDLYANFLQDEWELFAAVNRDMRKLPFSHTRFTKINEKDFEAMINQGFTGRDSEATLTYPAKNTALITIDEFNGRGENLSAFMKEVIQKKTENLIIDLRNNPGGGAGAAFQLVKHLTPHQQISGALVTNKWFDTTSRIPNAQDFNQFFMFTNGSTTELIRAMSQHAGVVLMVAPAKEIYTGKIYVLTSNRTASTCEPTVYGLKKSGRATIVGQKTAGKMLSAGAYYLSTGFLLSLPVADYYTTEGVRIEGNGIAPDVEVAADKALEEAMRRYLK